MQVTEKQLHILQHALGVDAYGRGKSYRTHFVTGKGSLDHADCVALTEAGMMSRHAGNAATGEMDVFHVTEAGRCHVRDHSPSAPKISKGKARYMAWLDSGAADAGISFGDWLKAGGGRCHG